MADALATRQHGIHELLWLQLVAIALAANLEPFHGVPRCVLNAQCLDAAHRLVRLQHLGDMLLGVARNLELTCQLDRIFNRQLSARANRKVRRVHSIAHQHHVVALGIFQRPLIADHTVEVDPGRAAQMARIGHQLFALQVVCKNLFTEGDGLFLIGIFQAAGLPGVFGGLDNKGRCLVVELVDMRLKPAVLCAHKIKGECLVHLVSAQPDKAVGTGDDIGLEDVLVLGANA